MRTGRPTVLLAACDVVLAGVYARRFERDGWDVVQVDDVKEAEYAAVRLRPAVFVLEAGCVADVAHEVRRLKALPTLRKTHLVVLAHAGHMAAINAALAAGAADYVLSGHVIPAQTVARLRRRVAA